MKIDLQILREGEVGKYLGLPKHFGQRNKDLFSLIVDKIKQRESGWSTKVLSSVPKLVMMKMFYLRYRRMQ